MILSLNFGVENILGMEKIYYFIIEFKNEELI
jgi:hypothetical protein